jgi:predicted PurR-regulated permease PerM
VLIFLLNFIPSIGSIIATIFPTILALVDGNSLWPFIIVGGGITALQFAIGNIIEPRLMGNTLNLSPLIILLSLALWGSIWGVAGAVLCVPITVICTIVCSYFPTTRPIAVLLSKNGQLKNLQDEESPTAPPAKAGAQTDPQLGEPRNDGKLSENSTRPHPVPDAS